MGSFFDRGQEVCMMHFLQCKLRAEWVTEVAVTLFLTLDNKGDTEIYMLVCTGAQLTVGRNKFQIITCWHL